MTRQIWSTIIPDSRLGCHTGGESQFFGKENGSRRCIPEAGVSESLTIDSDFCWWLINKLVQV
jgi:hypothetical protein